MIRKNRDRLVLAAALIAKICQLPLTTGHHRNAVKTQPKWHSQAAAMRFMDLYFLIQGADQLRNQPKRKRQGSKGLHPEGDNSPSGAGP